MNKTKVTVLVLVLCLSMISIGITTTPVSAALTTAWTPSLKTIDVVSATKTFSSLIKAVAKFEGTLQAYSVSETLGLEEKVLLASNDLGKSLESFNSEFKEIYPDMTKEQQEAFKDIYLSLSSYLEKLVEEANQIFEGEDGKGKVTFDDIVLELDIDFG